MTYRLVLISIYILPVMCARGTSVYVKKCYENKKKREIKIIYMNICCNCFIFLNKFSCKLANTVIIMLCKYAVSYAVTPNKNFFLFLFILYHNKRK